MSWPDDGEPKKKTTKKQTNKQTNKLRRDIRYPLFVSLSLSLAANYSTPLYHTLYIYIHIHMHSVYYGAYYVLHFPRHFKHRHESFSRRSQLRFTYVQFCTRWTDNVISLPCPSFLAHDYSNKVREIKGSGAFNPRLIDYHRMPAPSLR
jgi:hypothetical protein